MKLTNSQYAELLLEIAKSDEQKRPTELANFIKLLRRNRKLSNWREIVKIFQQKYNEIHKLLPIKITTAQKLSPVAEKNIISKLENKYEKKIEAEFSTDPEIIGGIKILGPDFLIENTIKNHLNNIKNKS